MHIYEMDKSGLSSSSRVTKKIGVPVIMINLLEWNQNLNLSEFLT